ncbi:DUF3951 domain-containing protein [Halobacillus litoralis]|uniref:DUF3951 domain-containing protein n=1 Tax=Halobacillus litoralis TaxID=45668 RepID=UPI001CD5C3B2|nr:DUF3951 domain-containing protein [Halobacillus litoralis]MCA0971897.1 DUF3951 domain-containing protein [Halobacillus litoralis]
MLLNAIGMTIVGVGVLTIMIFVAYKLFIKKESIDTSSAYTPFDYIAGQSNREFHTMEDWVQEEKEGGDDASTP